jgi:hypothetical protein
VIQVYDKFLALALAFAGLAALVFGHLVDGAETAALFVTVAGAAGVVGLQMLAAVIHAVLTSGVASNPVTTAQNVANTIRFIDAPTDERKEA